MGNLRAATIGVVAENGEMKLYRASSKIIDFTVSGDNYRFVTQKQQAKIFCINS